MPKRTKLPDPDEMNDQRAEWGMNAIQSIIDDTAVDTEDALCDLLADLAHACDENKELGNFHDQLRRALSHYEAETEGEGKQMEGISVLLTAEVR